MNYLEQLNQAQKEAVLYTDGPLLILAGAGAGKTKTITHRILHLIKQGVLPENILAVTFTNKAAKEMRGRVRTLLGEKETDENSFYNYSSLPFVSTFHSLGVYILKENHKELGIKRNFTIFDKNDSKRAIKSALAEAGFDPKQYDPAKVQNTISKQKGDHLTFERYEAEAGNDFWKQLVSKVWSRYEKILSQEGALDFDDLLLKTAILLQKNEKVRKFYQEKWKYIHIDEYQDTNKTQYEISKLLSEEHKNICAVGDIDQNIYSWRGADIENIFKLEQDYPEIKTVLLEQNYRSTQTILVAANEIIKKNKMRKEKNLFTKNEEGEKIFFFSAYNESDEAMFVSQKAEELIKDGVSPQEIAVLYRANFQSRVLEEFFLNKNIPYQVLGVRFFERKEVKDILSFIRASLNQDSASDIKRIIDVPPRGIGKVTLLKIFAGKRDELKGATKTKVDDFYTLLDNIKNIAEKDTPSNLVKFVIKETGIEDTLKQGKSEEDKERLENIKELVTLASKYDLLETESNIEKLEKLLEDASLASDQDEMEKNTNSVKLMTIHASKGLEFEYVFITGLEQGLFPSEKGNNPTEAERSSFAKATADKEEERRLFYVALTRAKKRVFLSSASIRTIFGSRQVNTVSEFVTDINEDLIEGNNGNDTKEKIIYLEW